MPRSRWIRTSLRRWPRSSRARLPSLRIIPRVVVAFSQVGSLYLLPNIYPFILSKLSSQTGNYHLRKGIKVHVVPDNKRPETWTWSPTLTVRREGGYEGLSTPAEIRSVWNEYAESFAEPFRSAFLSLPGDAVLWCERLAQWPTVEWDGRKGTVTLAGDAAHPMTYRKLVTALAEFIPILFLFFCAGFCAF